VIVLGLNVRSKSHYVAVGQGLEDVKEFGVYADDLTEICLILKETGVTSVAMESTGNYCRIFMLNLSGMVLK